MTAKESFKDSADELEERGPNRCVIEVEDHTDEAMRAELAQIHILWKWTQAQRAAGYLPN